MTTKTRTAMNLARVHVLAEAATAEMLGEDSPILRKYFLDYRVRPNMDTTWADAGWTSVVLHANPMCVKCEEIFTLILSLGWYVVRWEQSAPEVKVDDVSPLEAAAPAKS